MTTIKERRTIRKYKSTPIAQDLLNRLLEEAMRTPTMGNMQLYSVVATTDPKVKAELAPAHFNQPMVMGAPLVLTFCADFNRASKWCEQREAQPGYDNFLSFINAASDTLLLTQTFCNLAEAEGLGTCYLGTTVYMPKDIIRVLNLPRLVFPVATITVGYPDEWPEQTDRLPLDGILHHDTYKDYLPADIDRIYAYKESLEESKRFVAENNKKTLAQVFTDVRYTKNDNVFMSKGLMEALEMQGFG